MTQAAFNPRRVMVPNPNGFLPGITSTEDAADDLNKACRACRDAGGGTIKLNYVGNINIKSPLILYSNTTLDLGGNTLTLTSAAQTFLISNRAHDDNIGVTPASRDENIGLINGRIVSGGQSGASADAAGEIHDVVFRGVDGLRLENLEQQSTGDRKFAFCIGDCTRITARDIHFDGARSDGMHFYAPCTNVFIQNISGTTGDNMLAFGVHDWSTAYIVPVSDIGNMVDVIIDGVFCNDMDITPVRFHGDDGDQESGSAGTPYFSQYYFDNVNISRIVGNITAASAGIVNIGAEEGVWIKRLNISDIQMDFAGSIPAFNIAGSNETTVESLRLDKINISNTGNVEFLKVNASSTVNEIIVSNTSYAFAEGNTSGEHFDIDGNLLKLKLDNCTFTNGATMVKWGGSAPNWTTYTANTSTYASATTFTHSAADTTDVFYTGVRVRAVGSSTGTIYGTVTDSVFSTNTTVTVDWDDPAVSGLVSEALTLSTQYVMDLFANNLECEVHTQGVLITRSCRTYGSSIKYRAQDEASGKGFIYGFSNTGEIADFYGTGVRLPANGNGGVRFHEFVPTRTQASIVAGPVTADLRYCRPAIGAFCLNGRVARGTVAVGEAVTGNGTAFISASGSFTP